MPNVEEHCKSTLKRYGVEGRDIHQWLDEPSRKYAGGHREFRHDTETIRLVGKIFGKNYGSLAGNIALDHIMLDHKEEIEKRRTIAGEFSQEKENPSFPCSFCRTLVKPGDQICPKCGASRTKIVERFERAFEMDKLKLQEKKKKLRRELKLELALGELTPLLRVSLWILSDDSYDSDILDLIREFDDSPLTGEESWLPSDQAKALERLGFLEPFAGAILDRLVQEDFKKHPELKEEADKVMEQTKAIEAEMEESEMHPELYGKENNTKWWK